MTNLTFWTNLSIIWLAFLGFILTLVPLVIFYFAMRGMFIVNRTLPRYLKLGQYYSGIVRDQTTRVSLKVAEPMVRAHGEAARTQAFLQSLQPQRNRAAESTIHWKRGKETVNHKTRALLIGVGAGAFLGASFAWIASERSRQRRQGNALSAVKSLGPMDYFALGIALLTLARQFGGMLKKA